MKILNNKLGSTFLFIALVLGGLQSPYIANAQSYGQSERKPVVIIDKKIGYLGEKDYFDNVSSDQKLFAEGDQILFKIVVENKNDISLYDLKIKDVLPKYLTLMFYPGILNKASNSIETEIKELKAGESKEFLIVARISDVPTSNYASAKFAEINNAYVSGENLADRDSAKYFVAYKSIAATGANDIAVQTVGVIVSVVTAIALRKKARGY